MQTEQTVTSPEFTGSKEQQELAGRLFPIFLARGRFFAGDAPIRVTLAQLTEFMSQQEPGVSDWRERIDAALSASPAVFAREETDGDVVFATTRFGRPPVERPHVDVAHTLARRFAEPEPKRETRVRKRAVRERSIISELPQVSEQKAAEMTQGPQEEREPVVVSTAPIAVEEAAEAEQVVAEQPAPVAAAVDVGAVSREELAEAIRDALGSEMSVARWGDSWMAEDRVQRFSRGELRRIEELLREQDGVATDEEIVEDVLGLRPTAPEFPATRFAVNYRLAREREFEYVGTGTLGVWQLTNVPAIGTSKRKPSEIGQDYRFLLDYRTPDENIEEGIVEHVISFYEYIHGVLPLDANLATLMPEPGFPDQRAARITFESPQTNETVVAELRFPTSNRGGFLTGFEDFFAANLIPGAVVTIESTDRPNHFLLEYFQMSGEDRKLLHLDERKGKYTFRSTTFYCAIQDDFVLTENRFPKLADAKPLDDRVRRRPEQVLGATFERVGENVGSPAAPRYWAMFTDLMAAANIERPISAEFLRDILTSGTYPEFSADETTEDAFFYQPAGQE